MLRKTYQLTLTVLLALIWCTPVLSQSSTIRDNAPLPNYKYEAPVGQNVPTANNTELVELFDNGPMITHPGGGAGGADASAIQSSLGMTLFGAGMQISAGNSVADDVTNAADWNIDEIHLYAYQTGSTTTSTINDVRFQIWNGAPNGGGAVIFGDLTTNRLSTTTWTNIYRVTETTLTNTQRPIMRVVIQFSPAINLAAGTYWFHWSMGGTLASGPWQPPVTIVGNSTTGNALQLTSTGWAPLQDGGSLTNQGVPFKVFGTTGAPTGPGPATDPNPAHNATNVMAPNLTLSWTNPAGATSNQVFFGTDANNLTQIHSGSLVSNVNVTGLMYNTQYFWRVNEIDGSGTTNGALWSFTTMEDPAIVTAYFNDFESGIAGWTVTNDGTPTPGCEWKVTARRTGYTLPGTGQVLRADTDDCGSGSNLNSTATLDQSINATDYLAVELQFANDWRTLQASDEAHVEVSTDGGTTWTSVWSQVGVSVRNTTETVMISSAVAGTNFKIRLRSVQPGWDWWWVVDDFRIRLWDFIPVELTSFTATTRNNDVVLNWSTATELNNQGFEVERAVNGQFEKVGYVAGNGTTSELMNYSFVDKNLANGTYSYRLKQVDFDGTTSYSQVVEVEVDIPSTYVLEQNYPNPFNPSTKIEFGLAVDSKVSIRVFDVLGQQVASLVQGDLAAGFHNVNFDASNLNSGVYFYTIEAKGVDGKNFSSTKKMMLMK